MPKGVCSSCGKLDWLNDEDFCFSCEKKLEEGR